MKKLIALILVIMLAVPTVFALGALAAADTNVALNKTYTGGVPTLLPGGENYTAKLTDGAAVDAISLTAGDWFAFYNHSTPADPSYLNTVNGVGTVTIDLADTYSAISKVRVNIAAGAYGISLPSKVEVFTSDNADSGFKSIGTVALGSDEEMAASEKKAAWFELALSEKASGRFVKLELTKPEVGGVWVFLNEIEVIADPDAKGVTSTGGDDETGSEDDSAASSAIASEVSSEVSSPAAASSATSEPEPGDSGNMYVFVIIALVAVAGTAIAIKVRR